jgi:hypothetical protein
MDPSQGDDVALSVTGPLRGVQAPLRVRMASAAKKDPDIPAPQIKISLNVFVNV